MIYQPEIMQTSISLAFEELSRLRFEDQTLVQSCVLYSVGVETPIWLAELICRQFGIPDSVLDMARDGDDVRKLASESYLIASKKGTKWAIKRCLKLVGLDVELIENFGALYNGEQEYNGTITFSGDNAAVFHVRVLVFKGDYDAELLYNAVREMLPVKCFLVI